MAKRVRVIIEIDVSQDRRLNRIHLMDCAKRIAEPHDGEVVYVATEDVSEMKQLFKAEF